MDLNTITCTAYAEEISPRGETLKKTLHKNLTFSLERNEFRDVVLSVNYPKRKEIKYILRDVQVHKKFAKDGKATVKIPSQKIQFMLSNCAPDKLIMFLKTMSTKLECLKKSGFVSDRNKMKSDLPRTFEEISPLTLRDLKEANEEKAKAAEKSDLFTPKGKRKWDGGDDKENQPLGTKLARKLLGDKAALKSSSSGAQAVLNPVKLTKEQTAVLEAVKSGRSIFFTGSAGTGKSFLLRRIIGALPPQHTFATASTGVAACHIGGTTLHQFAGIGSGKATLEQCVELASRAQVAAQWRKCRHLIIDEISMVDGDFFDKLETVARVVRASNDAFGGIQLIVCGDFLQLPPVTKGEEKRKFCFMSKSWKKCIQMNMELTDVRRQNDQNFIDILQNIRLGKIVADTLIYGTPYSNRVDPDETAPTGAVSSASTLFANTSNHVTMRCPDNVYSTLRATAKHDIHKDGILATRLCTHKEDVDKINQYELKKLTGSSRSYEATDSEDAYQKQINHLSPVPAHVELTVGAQVMLAKNLNVSEGLVNGARGVVTGFEKGVEGLPVVKFICGVEATIKPVRWTFKVAGGLFLTRKQIPLKLAWAISIHKSQGMTLDCVEISLSKVFESGQTYVALSRAKSLEGLRVLDFDQTCVRSDPEVLRFYHKMALRQKMMAGVCEEGLSAKRPKHW